MDKNEFVFNEDENTVSRNGVTIPLCQFEYDVLMTLWCVLPGAIDVGELLDECRHWGSLDDKLDGRVQLSNMIFLTGNDIGRIGLKIYWDEDTDDIMLRLTS